MRRAKELIGDSEHSKGQASRGEDGCRVRCSGRPPDFKSNASCKDDRCHRPTTKWQPARTIRRPQQGSVPMPSVAPAMAGIALPAWSQTKTGVTKSRSLHWRMARTGRWPGAASWMAWRMPAKLVRPIACLDSARCTCCCNRTRILVGAARRGCSTLQSLISEATSRANVPWRFLRHLAGRTRPGWMNSRQTFAGKTEGWWSKADIGGSQRRALAELFSPVSGRNSTREFQPKESGAHKKDVSDPGSSILPATVNMKCIAPRKRTARLPI